MVEGWKSLGKKLLFGLVCLGWIGLFLVLHFVGSGGVSLLLGAGDSPGDQPGPIVRTPWTEAILLDGDSGWEWVLPGMGLAGSSPLTPEGKVDPKWREALTAPKPSSSLLPGIEGLAVVRRKVEPTGDVQAELLAAEKWTDLRDLADWLRDRKGWVVQQESAESLRAKGDKISLECRFRLAPDSSELDKGTVKGWLLVSRID